MSDQSSYVSLYRRWRPKTFAEIVGQEEITRTLRNAVTTREVAHAYLLAGERGIGKTSVARILARAMNCLNPDGGEPDNRCDNCRTILAGRSLDIMEIDGASNRGIDHIRRLREEVTFVPTDLQKKVYIIDEVHMLTNEAFNALLKTLEEPPRHAVFIFATTEPHKVPSTIISRCQAFDFRKIPSEKIAARLAEIAATEEIGITEEAIEIIARRANGGLRDAIVMLEQANSYASEAITPEAVLDMLGLVGAEELSRFLEAIEDGAGAAVFATMDSLIERGKDLEVFLGGLIALLRDRLAAGSATETRDIVLCRGLLDVKAELFRSLDRRILLEIGLLDLMRTIGSLHAPSHSVPTALVPQPRSEADPPLLDAVPDEEAPGPPAAVPEPEVSVGAATSEMPESPSPHEPSDAAGVGEGRESPVGWKEMIAEIEGERIAIAAFLIEGQPRIRGNTLIIAFHPDHTFHKESLEKPANQQYLAGMTRRHLGEEIVVDIEIDGTVERSLSPREMLREKARLVCQTFDGTIVKEE